MNLTLPSKLQISARTDVGMTRSENQDSCDLFRTKSGALVAIVADGMGGHTGGATASQIAIHTIQELLSPTLDEAEGENLAAAIEEANRRIYDRALEEPELRGMGTTAVGMLFHTDGRAWVAHVGDSRAYRFRGGALTPITNDHSLVAELVRSGALSEEEAETDPRRNEILRSVGAEPTVQVDLKPVSVHPDDRFLLCSDGLNGPVSHSDMSSLISEHDPDNATQALIHRANEMGGPDNVTAIVLHYPDPDDVTDTRALVPEATAAEFDQIAEQNALQSAIERRSRVIKLSLLAAGVCVALLAAVLLLLVSQPPSASAPPTQPMAAQSDVPAAVAGPLNEATQSSGREAITPEPAAASPPSQVPAYELEAP